MPPQDIELFWNTIIGGIIVPAIDEDLLQHQENLVMIDLPQKGRENQIGTKGAILQLAQVVAANMRAAQETRLAQDEEK